MRARGWGDAVADAGGPDDVLPLGKNGFHVLQGHDLAKVDEL